MREEICKYCTVVHLIYDFSITAACQTKSVFHTLYMASISQSHYFLDGSRPYRGSTHARERLSMPPTAQPPTSSPCVRPGCRHPERGFKLLSTKSKHLAHHSWLGACFRTSEVSEGERRYLWKRNSLGDKFVLIPASSTRRHYKNS